FSRGYTALGSAGHARGCGGGRLGANGGRREREPPRLDTDLLMLRAARENDAAQRGHDGGPQLLLEEVAEVARELARIEVRGLGRVPECRAGAGLGLGGCFAFLLGALGGVAGLALLLL